MTDAHRLTLSNDTTRVGISPDLGGAIMVYRSEVEGRVYDWMLPATTAHPSCFVMLPYCSRIRDACFEFQGRRIRLPANNLPETHSIHGHGWLESWQVLTAGNACIELEYRHEPDEWPWRYLAQLQYELAGMSLRLRLSLKNLSARPMPAGFGVHPFFTSTANTRLVFQAASIWELDDQRMSVYRHPLRVQSGEALELEVGTMSMDRVYSGRLGTATLIQPEHQAVIRIEADDIFSHLIVYAEPQQGFVCVEPVSNVADAFNIASGVQNRTDIADLFQIIEPGGCLSGSISVIPELNTMPETGENS